MVGRAALSGEAVQDGSVVVGAGRGVLGGAGPDRAEPAARGGLASRQSVRVCGRVRTADTTPSESEPLIRPVASRCIASGPIASRVERVRRAVWLDVSRRLPRGTPPAPSSAPAARRPRSRCPERHPPGGRSPGGHPPRRPQSQRRPRRLTRQGPAGPSTMTTMSPRRRVCPPIRSAPREIPHWPAHWPAQWRTSSVRCDVQQQVCARGARRGHITF